MSDHSQSIVDIQATETEAVSLAGNVRQYLIERGTIEAVESDCTLGDPFGHPPGINAAEATDDSIEMLMQLRTNGVAITVGRRVYDTGENGVELTCAQCQTGFEPDGSYYDAVQAWFDGESDVIFQCPCCKEVLKLTDWKGPFAFGLGWLGITFWNWPPLKAEFVRGIAKIIGHQVVLVHCHL